MSGLDEKGLEAAARARAKHESIGKCRTLDEQIDYERRTWPRILSSKELEPAISAYLAATTPANVGKLVGRLRSRTESVYDYATQGAEWKSDALCQEAATALERVTRERDEALKGRDDWKDMFEQAKQKHGYCIVRGNELADKLSAAEAKLAEARKVIERYERGLNTLATTFCKDDQHQEYARHVLDIRNLEPRHD